MPSARLTALFDRILRHRWKSLAGVLIVTGILGARAASVRPDYSIEMAFPRFDQARVDYERFKLDFPFEDATALVVVEAPDIFTSAGLQRIAALENDLARMDGVIDTQGLTTVRDIVSDGVTIRTDLLVPSLDLTPDQIASIRRTATSAPLFVWNLAPPDGRATTIQVTLSPDHASSEATRTRFLLEARAVLAQHDDRARRANVQQRLTLNGLPVIRSEFTELINADLGRLFPAALLVILCSLYLSFRSLGDVSAAFVTIIVSVVWTVGVMGLCGVPLQVLTQITPLIVMVVSISDTSHILSDYREQVVLGRGSRKAIAHACAANALPCLLTEITIAAGFSGLAFNDMVMIQQFGLATAAGAGLAWAANMTVLPLALSFLGSRQAHGSRRPVPLAETLSDRLVRAIVHTVLVHPARVAVVASVVISTALLVAPRVGREYYSYDDLRPSGALFQDLRRVEATFGGTVPLAIYIEPAVGQPREPNGMLEPAALALIDRITRRLETHYPDDIRNVSSIAEYLGKAHGLFTSDDPGAGALPATRRLAAQELTAVDEPRILRNLISTDRSTAAVFAMVPDRGSTRASHVIAELRGHFDREERDYPYRITITGIYGVTDGIYRSLVGGLARSLGWAVVISFLVFCVVLRSARLALIALVPNLLPLLLTAAIMGALGIDLKPTTVVIFSIALVIADDDTIQYLSRFRARYVTLARAAHPAAHRQAAIDTLRDSGPPMSITAVSVALGFGTLMLSQFVGLANLGLLVAITLIVAFVADAFLTPLLIITLRPRISVSPDGPTTDPPV